MSDKTLSEILREFADLLENQEEPPAAVIEYAISKALRFQKFPGQVDRNLQAEILKTGGHSALSKLALSLRLLDSGESATLVRLLRTAYEHGEADGKRRAASRMGIR